MSNNNNNNELCTLCLNKQPTSVLVPCKHTFCWDCLVSLLASGKYKDSYNRRCPHCRTYIIRVQQQLSSENNTISSLRCLISSQSKKLYNWKVKQPVSRLPTLCCECLMDLTSPDATKYCFVMYAPLCWLMQIICSRPLLPCGHALCWGCAALATGNIHLPKAHDTTKYIIKMPKKLHIQCPECRISIVGFSLFPEILHRQVLSKQARLDNFGFYTL